MLAIDGRRLRLPGLFQRIRALLRNVFDGWLSFLHRRCSGLWDSCCQRFPWILRVWRLFLHVNVHRLGDVIGLGSFGLVSFLLQTIEFIFEFDVPLLVVPDFLGHELSIPGVQMRHELRDKLRMCDSVSEPFRLWACNLALLGVGCA